MSEVCGFFRMRRGSVAGRSQAWNCIAETKVSMHKFLRLKSLRIPALPGAEESAALKPYPETEGLVPIAIGIARPPFGEEVMQHQKRKQLC